MKELVSSFRVICYTSLNRNPRDGLINAKCKRNVDEDDVVVVHSRVDRLASQHHHPLIFARD